MKRTAILAMVGILFLSDCGSALPQASATPASMLTGKGFFDFLPQGCFHTAQGVQLIHPGLPGGILGCL